MTNNLLGSDRVPYHRRDTKEPSRSNFLKKKKTPKVGLGVLQRLKTVRINWAVTLKSIKLRTLYHFKK